MLMKYAYPAVSELEHTQTEGPCFVYFLDKELERMCSFVVHSSSFDIKPMHTHMIRQEICMLQGYT